MSGTKKSKTIQDHPSCHQIIHVGIECSTTDTAQQNSSSTLILSIFCFLIVCENVFVSLKGGVLRRRRRRDKKHQNFT